MKNERQEIAELEQKLASLRAGLSRKEAACPHRWSNPEAAHIYHEGYRIEGDPPGVGGVDRRGHMDIMLRTEERWKRTCAVCGKVEYTTATTPVVTYIPKFYP